MKTDIFIRNDEGGKWVRCALSGLAAFTFSYQTTFGPNSAGYKRQFASQEEAIAYAKTWVNQ